MIEACDERTYLTKKQICERAGCTIRSYDYFRARLERDGEAWQEFFRYSARLAGPEIWADTLRRSKQGHVKDKQQFYEITGAIKKAERGDITINVFGGGPDENQRYLSESDINKLLGGNDSERPKAIEEKSSKEND
jgi:hypothetical protein